jgi:hypothetical protein
MYVASGMSGGNVKIANAVEQPIIVRTQRGYAVAHWFT